MMLRRNSRFLAINQLTEKTTLANDDLFIIEDSADTNKRKKVKKSNLGGVTAHTGLSALDWLNSGHTGTANRLAGFGAAGAADETAKEFGTFTPTLVFNTGNWNGSYVYRSGVYSIYGSNVIFSLQVLITSFPSPTKTANTQTGSPTLSNLSGFTLVGAGMYVAGTGIPAGAYILSVNQGAGTMTMSANATATNTGVTITFTYEGYINISGLPYTVNATGSPVNIFSAGLKCVSTLFSRAEAYGNSVIIFDVDGSNGNAVYADHTNVDISVTGYLEIDISGFYGK